MNRNGNLTPLIIIGILLFLIIPLIVSLSYGNVPFNKKNTYSTNLTSLESSNTNRYTNESYNQQYTKDFSKIKTEILKSQMTFSHIF